jgi:ribulose-phosphate 3-epimerase
MQIIPTVLEKEFDKAELKINGLGGLSKWVQIDVVDGVFSEGKSFELELLKTVEGEDWLWEIHLMVKEPINWINKCLFVSASRISGQVEMMSDREEFVRKVKDEGLEAGLAFDIETEIGEIPEETDLVLLMARKAGFGEYAFDKRVMGKIKKVKEMGFVVGVDGGINLENIKMVEEVGADIVYSGGRFEEIINVIGKQ